MFFFLMLRIHVGLISGKSTYYKQEITQDHIYMILIHVLVILV